MSLKGILRKVLFGILGSEGVDRLRYIKFSRRFASYLRSRNREDFIRNFSQSYEAEMAIIPRLVKNPKTIIDIGANYGTYSFFFSKIYPKSKIIAFEPASSSYSILRRIIRRFGLENVIPVKRGLGSKEEKKEIILPRNYTIIAYVADKNTKRGKEDKSEDIEVTTLDSFVKRNKINGIDLIKCDIEGFELSAFQGSKNVLKKFKPLVFVEIEQRHTGKYGIDSQDLIKFFKKLGYETYSVRKDELKETNKIVPEIPLYIFSTRKLNLNS